MKYWKKLREDIILLKQNKIVLRMTLYNQWSFLKNKKDVINENNKFKSKQRIFI